MANGNGTNWKGWFLGILATLITTGVIAAVGLGWTTSRSVVRLETDMDHVQESISRIETKVDSHILSDDRGGGSRGT